MDESTIKALLQMPVVTYENRKVIIIPYEEVLRNNISIHINISEPTNELKLVEPPVSNTEATLNIPQSIKKLYLNDQEVFQDCYDYLKVIAESWEFKHLSFQPSILKKAARQKPKLNQRVFAVMGKDGDACLTELININIPFIRHCWEEKEEDK